MVNLAGFTYDSFHASLKRFFVLAYMAGCARYSSGLGPHFLFVRDGVGAAVVAFHLPVAVLAADFGQRILPGQGGVDDKQIQHCNHLD